MEESIEQGIEKGKIEVGRRLMAKGMTVEEAAEIAGVGVDRLTPRSGLRELEITVLPFVGATSVAIR